MSLSIPFVRPAMPEPHDLAVEFAAIRDANFYTNFGPAEQRLRAGIEAYVGDDSIAVTVANATVGLMAALATFLPRGEGTGHVAIASFTFAAGADAIVWHGYRPAWIDVDPTSHQPSLASFQSLLESDADIRGILLTNTFGIANPAIVEWERIAAERGLPLIIDSAAGFGSRYPDGEILGARGDCEVFSFHATKPFAVGEGGAVLVRDRARAERLRAFTNFGFGQGGAVGIGMNAKLSEVAAAVGNLQLPGLDALVHERQQVLAAYSARLSGSALRFPEHTELSTVGFAPAELTDGWLAQAVLDELTASDVAAKPYYAPPVHRQPYFAAFEQHVPLSVTEALSPRMVALPVLSQMTSEEIDRVCVPVERILHERRPR